MKNNDNNISRREFLKKLGGSSLAVATVATACSAKGSKAVAQNV